MTEERPPSSSELPSRKPKTKEQAKTLASHIKDLIEFKEFIVEELELDKRELNIEFLRSELEGNTESTQIKDKYNKVESELKFETKEILALTKIENKLAEIWNFSTTDIEAAGPWTDCKSRGDVVINVQHTELYNTLEELYKEVKRSEESPNQQATSK